MNLSKATAFLAALTLMASADASLAAERFDGQWQTTVSCEASRGALGFSYRFVAVVKDGKFHGLHGTEGEPGSLVVGGKIADNGTARLYAAGRTGSKEYVPGRDTPRGTEYGYNIKAHFKAATGTGTRIEGRPCSFEFEKQ